MPRIALPPLDQAHRLQALRLIDQNRNPRTGRPLFPGLRAALLAAVQREAACIGPRLVTR